MRHGGGGHRTFYERKGISEKHTTLRRHKLIECVFLRDYNRDQFMISHRKQNLGSLGFCRDAQIIKKNEKEELKGP